MNSSIDNFVKKLVLASAAVLMASAATSQPQVTEIGFVDHPLLAGFPDSEIIGVEYSEDVNYRFVLGSLQRTRGQVVPEDSERIRGNVTKITYEISQEFTGADVYQYYLDQIDENNYTQLFTCEGRACGSSNYWANDIFRNRILYGPERNQYYLAIRAGAGLATDPSIALYIITRGNRRLYAYLEIIEIGRGPSSDAGSDIDRLTRSLQQRGSVVMSGVSFGSDDSLVSEGELELMVELMNQDPSLQIYLVAHLRTGGSVAELLSRSLARANLLRQAMIDRGIDASRISAQGVGPLAPVCVGGACDQRIELVLQ